MTKIEWCDEVWNPVTGCSPISEGCAHCYAKRMANRLKGRFGYPEDEPFRVTFHPDRLDQPSKWKKPKRVFVCSMGDLWHSDNDWPTIDLVFGSCIAVQQHTYLFLTKRIEAAWYYFKSPIYRYPKMLRAEYLKRNNHLWLGISAENQQTADKRIPTLLQIPAAKRFVSIEPMLGPVDLKSYISKLTVGYRNKDNTKTIYDQYPVLDWIILGGLSLPGGKVQAPDPEWIDSIVEQCDSAGVPLFIKDNARHYTRYALQPERREFPA